MRGLTPDPLGHMELGNAGGVATRHKEMREAVQAGAKAAFVQCHAEQTIQQIAQTCGVTDPQTIARATASLASTYRTARAGAELPRPSDLTLVRWATTARGRPTFGTTSTTVTDLEIATPESQAALQAGSAEAPVTAEVAARKKREGAKAAVGILGAQYVPLVFSSNGVMCSEAEEFLRELARRQSRVTRLPEDKQWALLTMELSVVLMRGNSSILRAASRMYAAQASRGFERPQGVAVSAGVESRRGPAGTGPAVARWMSERASGTGW